MKFKKVAFYSVKISLNDVSFITDPIITVDAIGKLPKTEADVVLVTQPKYIGQVNFVEGEKLDAKIVPENRDKLVQIASPGDYEVGGVIIRRPLGRNFYLLDHGELRVMYIGEATETLSATDVSDLGDVDVLILPVGGDSIGVKNDALEKIISSVDPTYLIPVGYKEADMELSNPYADVYSRELFLERFGYTHVQNSKTFKVKGSTNLDTKVIEVVLLD